MRLVTYQLPGDQLPKPPVTESRLTGPVILGVIVIVAGVLFLFARFSPGTGSNPTQPGAAPLAHVTLLSLTGNGIKQSQTFVAPDSWQIDYSFDCSGFGQAGNFAIYVYAGGGAINDVAANQIALTGRDTSFEHAGGATYLEVNSECSWTLTAHT